MHQLQRAALIAAFAFCLSAPAADAAFFQSPTGNIGCYINQGGARCDIAERDWSPPPKPNSCDLDWGYGLAVGESGRGQFFCGGDTVLHQGRKLAYGHSRSAGRVKCTSKTAGMRCVNRNTGHGFFISRQSYKRF